MPKTPDQLMEAETIIRWDESREVASLWTASSKVAKEWKSYGFPVVSSGALGSGWDCEVPIDRIRYAPLKKA